VLCNEAGIVDPPVIAAARLHDTLKDTDTVLGELERKFGTRVANTVREVSDDKTLSKRERKRLLIKHAPALGYEARLVELADKICNVRDMASSSPQAWTLERREYFDWAKAVVERLRGTHETLEKLFDEGYQRRP
jgi:GTP diphosphokinase / guanosine-3',5'-bis(diphosphate) 3'-diphosphatase